jgi:hypothetical protein
MTTQDLYNRYPIPKNLQAHMLRVAALAKIITDHWVGPNINQDSVVKACLFHDAGKLVKFDLNQTNMFEAGDHDLEYWRERQQEMIEKFGKEEHPATHGVVTEMGLPEATIELIEKMEWSDIDKHAENHDYEAGIAIYCDMRIGPFSLLTLSNRIANLKERRPDEDFTTFTQSGEKLEEMLQQNTSIDLNSITDDELVQSFESLLLLD